MSHNFNLDTSNSPLGADTVPQDGYRIVSKLGLAVAFMIVMMFLVLRSAPAWLSPIDKPMPTKAANDMASATRDAASARTNDNCDPITLLANDADNQASEKLDEVAVTPQAEKTPATVESHNRSGRGEHVQSGASRKGLQRVGTGSKRFRKPQFRHESPAPRVYGSSSVAAANVAPRLSILYRGANATALLQYADGSVVYPRRASTVGSSR